MEETETVKLGQITQGLTQSPGQANLSVRCECCGYGFKHYENGESRKWCKRCIDVYYRKEKLTPDRAEKTIIEAVGVRYVDATLESDSGIADKLLALEPGQDVFMFGAIGVGKTYTMAALLRHYVYEGFECKRINFDDFCVQVRSTMGAASKQTEYELIEPLKHIDKLFIDDLGLRSKQESDFAYITLFAILNKRQERMLPTFITTNKSIEQLGQSFDARIASRLQTALVIEMTGQDRRR
jgi:DNA replication protein DnaC